MPLADGVFLPISCIACLLHGKGTGKENRRNFHATDCNSPRILEPRKVMTMIRSRAVPTALFVSAIIFASGCITSAKIRNSPNCPGCQKNLYKSLPSAPADTSELYPVPEAAPAKEKGGTPASAPYPAPPPETRRLIPNFRARTNSSAQSSIRQVMNSFQ